MTLNNATLQLHYRFMNMCKDLTHLDRLYAKKIKRHSFGGSKTYFAVSRNTVNRFTEIEHTDFVQLSLRSYSIKYKENVNAYTYTKFHEVLFMN